MNTNLHALLLAAFKAPDYPDEEDNHWEPGPRPSDQELARQDWEQYSHSVAFEEASIGYDDDQTGVVFNACLQGELEFGSKT